MQATTKEMRNTKRAANNSKLKTLAEKMYVEEGLTASAVAEALSISPQTVGRWKKGLSNQEDWDTKRERHLREPRNIKRLVDDEVSRLVQGHESTLDMKAINEAIKAQTALSKGVSAEVIMTVFREFDNYMANQDPELAVKFTEYHKQFLIHKVNTDA